MIYLYAIFAQNCGACVSFKDKNLKYLHESVKRLESENKLKYIQIDLVKMGQTDKIPAFLREYIPGYPTFIIIDKDSSIKVFGHHVTKGSDGRVKLINVPTKGDSLLDWISSITESPEKEKIQDTKMCKYKIVGRKK